MKTMISLMFLAVIGMMTFQGCTKVSNTYVPISFTDKEGSIFIPIDTNSNSIVAYSPAKISTGRLKAIFNDTIRSSFYLAIATDPYWDTVFHARDTLVFPTHFPSHSLSIETDVDLKGFSSPYHFFLVGLVATELKRSTHGNPNMVITIDTSNE